MREAKERAARTPHRGSVSPASRGLRERDVVKRHKIEQKSKTSFQPGHTRQVLDEALWVCVWKCERLRCGGVMPREQPLLARARGCEGHNTVKGGTNY